MSGIDLSILPPPDIVEPLGFETIFQEILESFRVSCPEFDAILESDPAIKVLEVAAYREMLLRARINDAARSNLLAFAAGGDLDHLAVFYGLTRIEGESDERFRRRVGVQIAAIAGNGTSERYASIALSADPNVLDAAVLSQDAGSIDVALWISDLPSDTPLPPGTEYAEANAAHHATVLATVIAAFDAARTLGVTLTAYEAVPYPVNVIATIVRESTAPLTLVSELAAQLPQQIARHAQLGRDVSYSLILAWLHVTGVSKVKMTTPANDLMIPRNGYATPGVITLTDGGIDW